MRLAESEGHKHTTRTGSTSCIQPAGRTDQHMHPGKSFPQKCHFHNTTKCHVVTAGHVTTVGWCGYDKMLGRLLGCPNRIQKESGEKLDVRAYTEVAQPTSSGTFLTHRKAGHVGVYVGSTWVRDRGPCSRPRRYYIKPRPVPFLPPPSRWAGCSEGLGGAL